MKRNQSTRNSKKPILIKDDLWIGTKSIILKGGNYWIRCRDGNRFINNEDVEAFRVVDSNLATIIKERF